MITIRGSYLKDEDYTALIQVFENGVELIQDEYCPQYLSGKCKNCPLKYTCSDLLATVEYLFRKLDRC